jgi:hypothetical protein
MISSQNGQVDCRLQFAAFPAFMVEFRATAQATSDNSGGSDQAWHRLIALHVAVRHRGYVCII